MHPHLIDWLRRIHLNADSDLATKRWNVAKSLADEAKPEDVTKLLEAFLFEPVSNEVVRELTERILKLDSEFPPTGNAEEVRLLAGIIMVAAFSERLLVGDAFALGIRASGFPNRRCKPSVPAIISEADKFINAESERLRPSSFKTGSSLSEKFTNFSKVAAQPAPAQSAGEEVIEALDRAFGDKIRRLAEETELLWWLLGEYSPTLQRPTPEIIDAGYALIAASEAADRTSLLPPPPSIPAILRRAMSRSKVSKGRNPTIVDIVAAADSTWRAKIVGSNPIAGTAVFVPILTALARTEEAGDTDALAKVLPKACCGIRADAPLSPQDAAIQFYNELIFLKSIRALIDDNA